MGSFTVALFDALVSAGVAPERARAVADLFDRSVDDRYSLHAEVLATKRDLAELEPRLVRDLSGTRASIAETNARIAETNARIAETKADLVKWMLAALTAQTALIVGATRLL